MEQIDLKNEVIESIKAYLSRLIPGVENTVNLLRITGEDGVLEDLSDIFEGLEWLIEAVALTTDAVEEPLDISGVTAILPEMLDSLENTDYVVLADLLEYEIMPILVDWFERLK